MTDIPKHNSSHSALTRRGFLRNSALVAGAAMLPGASGRAASGEGKVVPGAAGGGEASGVLYKMPGGSGYVRTWQPRTGLIWYPDNRAYFDTPRNEWCYFRKTLSLGAAPKSALLWIFADARYRLFVNGRYIARGPARSDPRWQSYDVVDIAKDLHAGENLIAVQVLYYGYNTGQHIPRVPCMAAELHVGDDAGQQVYRTDNSWKTFIGESFDRDAPRVNGCQGAIEIFDARREPTGWEQPGFDDSSWAAAKVRPIARDQIPYNRLLERDIPLMEEKELTAARIAGPLVLAAHDEESFLPMRARLELDEIKKPWDFSSYAPGRRVETTPSGRVSIVTVDFSRITPGYLQLSVSGKAGTRIDVVYAEDLYEGRVTLFNPPAQRPLDSFILKEGRNDLEVAFAWKGFRYVQLIIRNPEGPLSIHHAGMRSRMYPVDQSGRVRTKDAFQWELHGICAHALRGCMQDGFIDSPSREQQQWMGDARWQAVYNYYMSGDHRLHRRLLYQIGQSQDAEGLTKSRYPDGHENWSPIPSYCLAWVTSFDDYYRFTGDLSPAAELWPNILMALRWFSRYENRDGLLENVPFWSYIDMSSYPETQPKLDIVRGGVLTPLNLLYLESIRAAERLAAVLGDTQSASSLSGRAKALAKAISSRLWDERRGAYPDCMIDGKLSDVISEPTNALALLHLDEPARARRIVEHFDETLHPDTAISSPFSMPLVIRALLQQRQSDLVWKIVRKRYQPIIDAGLGTTWEYWKVFYPTASGRVHAHSASHAWGAGPLLLFFEGFAGIQIVEPAFRKVSLDPQLPKGLDELDFAVPTPQGQLKGRYARMKQGIRAELDVPPGMKVIVKSREYSSGTHKVEI